MLFLKQELGLEPLVGLTSMSPDSDSDLDSDSELDSQNIFETPGKVPTVNLGQYRQETMLEHYRLMEPLFLQKKLFSSSFWFSWKIAFV